MCARARIIQSECRWCLHKLKDKQRLLEYTSFVSFSHTHKRKAHRARSGWVWQSETNKMSGKDLRLESAVVDNYIVGSSTTYFNYYAK